MQPFLNSPKYLMNILYKNFTHDEIVILLNNIEVFVKNDYVRSFFPKIKKETTEEIFNKNNSNTNSSNNTTKSNNELLPIIMPTEYKNKLMPEFDRKLQRRINNIINEERNKIINKHTKELKARKSLDKIINDMEYKRNNIENYSNQFVKKHPLVEYYMELKHKERQLTKCASMPLMMNMKDKPDKEKFKKLFEENKKMNIYLNEITNNLLGTNTTSTNN
jgi:hypothetical protein